MHVLQPQLTKMLKNIVAKYVKPAVLAESLRAGGHGLCVVDYNNPENHLPNESLVIGFVTRQTIRKLLEEGDTSSHQYAKSFNAAKVFLYKQQSIC